MSFFKSLWFKCTVVLLAIAVVAGGLLAVLNNVLAVSDKERTTRAIKAIYGTEMAHEIIREYDKNLFAETNDIKYQKYENEYGEITNVYKITNETENCVDYLFKSTGINGYKGGTITLWVKLSVDYNQNYKITSIVMESFDKQTLMSKLDANYYEGFYKDIANEMQNYFTADEKDTSNTLNVATNATKSSRAGANAVNCVIKYVRDGETL